MRMRGWAASFNSSKNENYLPTLLGDVDLDANGLLALSARLAAEPALLPDPIGRMKLVTIFDMAIISEIISMIHFR